MVKRIDNPHVGEFLEYYAEETGKYHHYREVGGYDPNQNSHSIFIGGTHALFGKFLSSGACRAPDFVPRNPEAPSARPKYMDDCAGTRCRRRQAYVQFRSARIYAQTRCPPGARGTDTPRL